ncbi:aminotransferase class V-fold PLP-dependent enzyme [Gemmatimonadota bacterium]
MSISQTRRSFIRTLAAGIGAPVSTQLLELEEAFAGELADASELGTLPHPFQGMRDRYLLDPTVTFLNHASIGTVPRAVHSAGMRYREICEENPWLYIWGGAWEEALGGVRKASSFLLGCQASDVAITHNTTEGFNLLAQGLPLGPGDEILFSTLNHTGASICWEHMATPKGYAVRRFEFPLRDVPGMSAEEVVQAHAEQIRDETRVLVFPHVDNIVGLRHPMARLNAMAKKRGVDYVLVDGAQSAGMIPLEVEESGVDAFSTSPHKWIQSPKGLGLLYIRDELLQELRPMWVTWGQARWQGTARIYEDYGTRDLPEVLALGSALDFQSALGESRKVGGYREMFGWLKEAVAGTPGLVWRSPSSWDRGASLVSVEVPGRAVGPLAESLFREQGVVLRAFPQTGLNSLRISPNLMNTHEEVLRLVEILEGP